MNYLSTVTKRTAVRELILWVGAITIITLCVVGVSFYLYTTRTMVNSLQKQAHVTADEIASVLNFPLYSMNDQAAINNTKVYLTSGKLSGIRLISDASGVLVDSLINTKSLIPPIERRIIYKEMSLGSITVVMDDSEIRSAQRTTLIIISLLIFGLIFVYALLLHSVFKKVLSVNFNQIIQGINRFGDNKFDDKIKSTKYKDLDQLVLGLNTMADSIHKNQLEIIEAQQELYHLRNYLSNIIDSMPSVLVGVDLDYRVTQWNKTAEQTTGITAREAHGKLLSEVFPRMVSQMEKIAKSIQTREINQEQKMPHVSEGNSYYEDVTIYPLIANGVQGAVIRIDDVTEQVRLEEVIVQSEKMLSVGGLAAGMAHEINNPLAGMMQTADVMANRLGKSKNIPANFKAAEAAGTTMEAIHQFMDARDIPRMLTTIHESGQRVAAIVNNMLSFARKNDASMSSQNPADLIDKILELASADYDLKKQYDFKAIEIIKEYENNLPLVLCEGAKIQQVLLNILRNGAEAMQEAEKNNPRFILRLSHESDTNMLRMEIEDNGPGMNEDTRKRIFEPFFTTKPVGVGTGLGLSVSYFIITESHNGTMDVLSIPGTGTKFIIRLPLEEKIHE